MTKGFSAIIAALLLAFGMVAGCQPDANQASDPTTPVAEQAADAAAIPVPEAGTYLSISQEEAHAIMEAHADDVAILDARTEDEFATGHIAGAVCLPHTQVSELAPDMLPDLDQVILVYCRSGNRSKQAASALAQMGYTNVLEFGGVNTWPYGLVTD